MSKLATFAGGCFWGVEAAFLSTEGVLDTRVGYSGGETNSPSYEEVCTGSTGHAEVVEVVYDPEQVSFEELLLVFWKNQYGPTRMRTEAQDQWQYRSVVYYHNNEQKEIAEQMQHDMIEANQFPNKIETLILPVTTFWPAEEYHQRYFEKHGGSCA